jgi:hypothetical protein
MTAHQVLTRNTQVPVRLRPGGIADLMIILSKVSEGDMHAELHIAVIAKIGSRCDSIEDLRDRFDLLVIGSDPGPYQAIRCGQTIKHVYFHHRVSRSK